MSRGCARFGDRTLGTCAIHGSGIGGTIVTASPDKIVNGRGCARIGDIVLADCGHTSKIITGSPTTLVNGRLCARLSDRTDGSPYRATIMTASGDTYLT